jgi:hybrid cluster-associated redox disulfide protein
MSVQLSKNMTFSELLAVCPGAAEILMSYGLHCIGCHIAVTETIEQGAMVHGLSEDQIDAMIMELSASVS